MQRPVRSGLFTFGAILGDMITPPSADAVHKAILAKGYTVFLGDGVYDLNIVGIRAKDLAPNQFNDWITVMYRQDGRWLQFAFPATTDPGTYYRNNPMNVAGTAVLKAGQYRGSHMVGLHTGYEALRQKGELAVYRDANRNDTLELDESKVQRGTGFLVDIHRANPDRPSKSVDKWSAGCQVFQDPIQFGFFMELAKKSAKLNGNSFTYTLLDEADFAGV